MPINALKASWEVRAGLIPGEPRREFTRRFHYTSQDLAEDEKHGNEIARHSEFDKMRAVAMDYFAQVSMPAINNWAEITFIWY